MARRTWRLVDALLLLMLFLLPLMLVVGHGEGTQGRGLDESAVDAPRAESGGCRVAGCRA